MINTYRTQDASGEEGRQGEPRQPKYPPMACCCQCVKALKCFRMTVKDLKTQKDLPAHWVTPLVAEACAWLEGGEVAEASFADLVDRQNKLQQAVQELFDRKVP